MNLKNLLKRAIATTLVSMLCLIAFAQGHSVSGIIKDATGEPMIGVNVLEKGTTNGVITNIDGHFTLNGITDKSILVISYIGYVQQNMNITSKSSAVFNTKADNTILDEVIVSNIGYDTANKRDLTSSVVSIRKDIIATTPTSNVMEALQGRIAEANILKISGAVGEDMNILLRGTRSIKTI